MLIGLPLMTKWCLIPDSAAVLVGAAAHSAARVVFIFATQPYMLYIGATLSGLGPVVAPVVKSMVSKVVPLRDRGKITFIKSEIYFSLIEIKDNKFFIFVP